MKLDFNLPAWQTADIGAEEIRQTYGALAITVGDRIVTRVEDDWSKSIRESVFVSAYPLAMWFAASWWRLRWEPASASKSVSWRMAHDMSATGCGFLWPRLVFEFDGEKIQAICRQTERNSTEPIRFLESFRLQVNPPDFEQAVDSFLELVLARLYAVGIHTSELKVIWSEVCEERRDPVSTAYRRLEAILGYEPDEAPDGLVGKLQSVAIEAGQDTIDEIALACAGDNPDCMVERIVELARQAESDGQEGKIEPIGNIPRLQRETPWERGRELAQVARKGWNVSEGAVSDDKLAGVLNLDGGLFQAIPNSGSHGVTPPIGLAIRGSQANHLRILLRKSNHHARRFETARLLADHLLADSSDKWLATTEMRTVRQKVQRAFAAEFLCPIKDLHDYLDGVFSTEAVDNAGDHFDVSPRAVISQLQNNVRLLSPVQQSQVLELDSEWI